MNYKWWIALSKERAFLLISLSHWLHPERNEAKRNGVEGSHSWEAAQWDLSTSLEMTQMQHISTCFTSSGSNATWSKGEIPLSLQWHLALASILDFGYDSVWWKKYPFSHWVWFFSSLSIWSASIFSMISNEEHHGPWSSRCSIVVSLSHEEYHIWSWSRWRWSHVSLSYDYWCRSISLAWSSSCSWQGR